MLTNFQIFFLHATISKFVTVFVKDGSHHTSNVLLHYLVKYFAPISHLTLVAIFGFLCHPCASLASVTNLMIVLIFGHILALFDTLYMTEI